MSDADIFINYRTSDEAGCAALIAELLAARFGPERIFWDHGSIRAAERYPERLATAVGRCSVLIAVIGDRWLEARDARGQRRLDNEDDWTRREIVEVLRRGAHLIPVLVAPRTAPLRRDELPDALGDLAELQFRPFNPRTKENDIATLCRDLAELLPSGAGPAPDEGAAGRDGGIRNSSEGGHGNATVQARDVSGGIGSLITNPQGPVHSGQGDQHKLPARQPLQRWPRELRSRNQPWGDAAELQHRREHRRTGRIAAGGGGRSAVSDASRTFIDTPASQVHSGDGDQYNEYNYHLTTLLDSAAFPHRKPSRAIAPDELVRLERRFVAPGGLGRARTLLSETRTVLLVGEPGTGSCSAAAKLLWSCAANQGVCGSSTTSPRITTNARWTRSRWRRRTGCCWI